MGPSSLFNHVLGPVMHGPSSSHTAASFHIARIARSALGENPAEADIAFDPVGAYAEVYRQQGSDRAFAMGIMGRDITDPVYKSALEAVHGEGVDLTFTIKSLEDKDHPNAVEVLLTGASGRKVALGARSVGGGSVEVTSLGGIGLSLRGDAWDLVVLAEEGALPRLRAEAGALALSGSPPREWSHGSLAVFHAPCLEEPPAGLLERLRLGGGVRELWLLEPVFFPARGELLFSDASAMISYAGREGVTLGEAGLRYEAALLGLSREEAMNEMKRRYRVMEESVRAGLSGEGLSMRLMDPVAGSIMEAESRGGLALGGLHTRAAARALAAMHVNASGGLVVAAPTAGSAGTIPGVAVTLRQEMGLGEEEVAKVLFAASCIGLVISNRATFAAEVAGCQVEIGAAGAMAAAGVVEFAGGSAAQACDAAAIFLQNWMGSVCDPVQGFVEIPCHTRNAVASSEAFVCADLVLGGYVNPVPLDETVDAVLSVGKMLPRELRCTVLGGLSTCPSARALKARGV